VLAAAVRHWRSPPLNGDRTKLPSSVSDVSTLAGLRLLPPSPPPYAGACQTCQHFRILRPCRLPRGPLFSRHRSVSDVSTLADLRVRAGPPSRLTQGACQTCQHPRNPVRAEEGRDRRSRAVSKHAGPSRRHFSQRLQCLLRTNGGRPTAARAAPRSRNPRRPLPPPNGSAPPPGRRRRNRGAG